jgi:hypothetical protein
MDASKESTNGLTAPLTFAGLPGFKEHPQALKTIPSQTRDNQADVVFCGDNIIVCKVHQRAVLGHHFGRRLTLQYLHKMKITPQHN